MRARTNRDIELTEHDGTQFIWVGDLAKIYSGILQTQLHRRVFHGLASDFVSWERIAEQAIEMCNSRSKIMLQDKGWSDSPCLYDVSGIQKQFHLSFSPHVHITDHLRYLMGLPIPEEYDE
jgi:UDP-glucose 4-epimerase